MTNCPHCGSANAAYIDAEGDKLCLCGYIYGTPLPCLACSCRDGCTGHPTLLRLGQGNRKMDWCQECSVTEKEEAVGN